MNTSPVSPAYRFLRIIGSLWFAAVLLMLLLLALACATVFESMTNTEHALSVYYRAPWFTAILGLFGINVLAAIVLRIPFGKWRIGFVMTHAAILLIFTGALVTRYFAEDGQVVLTEGQSLDEFVLRGPETLTLLDRRSGQKTEIDLDPGTVGGLSATTASNHSVLQGTGLSIQVEGYVPDSEVVEQMRNDNPLPRPAVQVSLAGTNAPEAVWVFPNQRASVGPLPLNLRVVNSDEELTALLTTAIPAQNDDQGRVRIEYKDQVVERPVSECLELPIAVGDTGVSFRVLRFMPHATVGANNTISNTSDKPINPAIEVEIASDAGVETRLAFAKFPSFAAMHAPDGLADLTVTHLRAASAAPPTTPVELLLTNAGKLFARFRANDGAITTTPVTVGEAVPTPWTGRQLTVHQALDHARFEQSLRPVDPPRKNRVPGIEVRITSASASESIWLQKHRPLPITVDQKPYEIGYGPKTVPLGFSVKLDSFRVGYYPGEQRPRSFESRVSLTDTTTGLATARLISMNHPTDFGGYTFFQSSYQMDGGRKVSILSVARDPGTMIVFAGYALMICGMTVVLFTRYKQQQTVPMVQHRAAQKQKNATYKLDLMNAEHRCNGGGACGHHDGAGHGTCQHATELVDNQKAGAISR